MKTAAINFDVQRVRQDFPVLRRLVRDKPLVYLDNASTTQKPQAVIERMTRFYESENANVHRGVHYLSEIATTAYEEARNSAQRFLNAADRAEIILVRGCTEAINLVAHSFGRSIRGGDEIVVSEMEHHSNFVPWQVLCEMTGARLIVAPVDSSGQMRLDAFSELLSERTKLVAVVHLSNALGILNPVHKIIEMAHAVGAKVLLDGAQAVAHLTVDVQKLGCDFYAMSGHKVFGPTGIGVLYGKRALLEEMPPFMTGGDMVERVSIATTTYNELPYRLEAGTPNIAGALGLAAAIDYVQSLGHDNLAAYERCLLDYAISSLQEIDGLSIAGAGPRAGVLSFTVNGIHPNDIAILADQQGVAMRAGQHCAQPLMRRLGLPGTARASFAFYNTVEEVDLLESAVRRAIEVLR